MNLKRSGVYGIRNEVNGKRYIGSSTNIQDRFRRHKRDLRKGKHHSILLQRAWNKYGENSFTFYVEEFCKPERLLHLEDMYLLFGFPEYNINPFASTTKGRKLSKETKDKIGASIRKLGVKPPESTWKSKRKRVSAIDPTTKQIVKTFDSLSDACRWLGRNHTFVTMLSRCCNGKTKSGLALGFGWQWEL